MNTRSKTMKENKQKRKSVREFSPELESTTRQKQSTRKNHVSDSEDSEDHTRATKIKGKARATSQDDTESAGDEDSPDTGAMPSNRSSIDTDDPFLTDDDVLADVESNLAELEGFDDDTIEFINKGMMSEYLLLLSNQFKNRRVKFHQYWSKEDEALLEAQVTRGGVDPTEIGSGILRCPESQ